MEQQIFNKQFIYERIKDAKTPLWSLGLWQGFKNVANVMQYNGSDFEDDDSDETKVEKSIAQLANTISTFPPESVFVIELKSTPTANRNGIFGPYQFTNSDKPRTSDAQPSQPTLGSVAAVPPSGYIPESMLKGVEERLQKQFAADLDRYKAESERRRQEDEYQRKLEALEEREKEVKDLEKAYNSTVAKAADVVVEIGKRLGTYFLAPSGAAHQAAAPTMAAAQLGQVAHQPSDEKAQAVDDFAEFLYKNFSADAIRTLKQNITNYAQQSTMAQPGNGAAHHGADGD